MSKETASARRVLIVEDEILLAMALADILDKLGHRVVNTATRLDQALALAREEDIDFAVLDINLAGITSFAVADVLHERGIPFVFATGYGSQGLSEDYRHQPVLTKPYRVSELVQVMAEASR